MKWWPISILLVHNGGRQFYLLQVHLETTTNCVGFPKILWLMMVLDKYH